METTLKSLTVISTSVFALWALYISVVEHPARMHAGAGTGRAQFRESYRRAAPWQASAAAISLLSGLLASIATREWTWGVAGIVVGAAIPFTLIVIRPTNEILLRGNPSEAETAALLSRWGRLHWVRSILGLGALVLTCSRLRVL